MRKTTVILILIILVVLLFIFQNIYSLFQEFDEVGVKSRAQLMGNINTMKKIFFALSLVTGLLLAATGIYLVFLFKKAKEKQEYQNIPPLQDYLLQLQTSESQLKDMVETQQEKVVQKEELNKSIINNINDAIIFLNSSGRIEIFNAAAETMFSQSYANAMNNRPEKVLADFSEVAEFVERHEDEAVSREIASKEKIFWVNITPIDGIGAVLIIRDVTEEKKREEIDRRVGNFAMLGEMTAFLAHEVRNSLGVIFGYTKTIKTEKEKTSRINKEILFLTDMMESFLNFSKPVTIDKKEKIDLVPLLKKIAAEKEIAIEVADEPAVLENDPALIHSIFSNLILNSKQAGADKVEVTVKTDGDMEIYLTDNGGGIDEKNREKIWYPFFTTRDKGTGMGLPSIRKIINSLKGEIILEDSSAGGTTFKIVFYG